VTRPDPAAGGASGLLDELRWRGLFQDSTAGLAARLVDTRPVAGYVGFDPTGSSLHVGHLVPIFGLLHLQRHGGRPVALVGGGTGMIGDPSGRSAERNLLTRAMVVQNTAGIRLQLERFLDFDGPNGALMADNHDWLGSLKLLDFLRDVGKHFTIPYMLAKDSVHNRLEAGLSYTEFSYMLLQATDFLELHRSLGVELQMGGADQWGNITAGIDLIRRVRGAQAHALVWPLLTTASGAKFGKTESGAIWLDAKRTSPYRFYQYWLNAEDQDVVSRLKQFTLLSQPEIEELADSVTTCPEKREAQRKLAQEITRSVHGQSQLDKAEQASKVLFGEAIRDLCLQDVLDIFAEVPSVQIGKDLLSGEGISVVDLVAASGLAQSKGEARRLIQGGGLNLNNVRITDFKQCVRLKDAVEGQALILRKGQKEYRLMKVV
jgi:tyrosyl-tRNA synthetase